MPRFGHAERVRRLCVSVHLARTQVVLSGCRLAAAVARRTRSPRRPPRRPPRSTASRAPRRADAGWTSGRRQVSRGEIDGEVGRRVGNGWAEERGREVRIDVHDGLRTALRCVSIAGPSPGRDLAARTARVGTQQDTAWQGRRLAEAEATPLAAGRRGRTRRRRGWRRQPRRQRRREQRRRLRRRRKLRRGREPGREEGAQKGGGEARSEGSNERQLEYRARGATG